MIKLYENHMNTPGGPVRAVPSCLAARLPGCLPNNNNNNHDNNKKKNDDRNNKIATIIDDNNNNNTCNNSNDNDHSNIRQAEGSQISRVTCACGMPRFGTARAARGGKSQRVVTIIRMIIITLIKTITIVITVTIKNNNNNNDNTSNSNNRRFGTRHPTKLRTGSLEVASRQKSNTSTQERTWRDLCSQRVLIVTIIIIMIIVVIIVIVIIVISNSTNTTNH